MDSKIDRIQRRLANQSVSKSTDPVLEYGAGIKNYFRLLKKLLYLFGLLSLISFAQMYIYKSYGGLNSLGEYVVPSAQYSFGNMGFSSSTCAKMPIDWMHEDTVTLRLAC